VGPLGGHDAGHNGRIEYGPLLGSQIAIELVGNLSRKLDNGACRRGTLGDRFVADVDHGRSIGCIDMR
jgi:hypothetical protein